MADKKIRGITIELGGDTSGLVKAIKDADKEVKSTQKNLKDLNKALKLDPKNVELLKQKQELLNKAVEESNAKVKALKDAQEAARKEMEAGNAKGKEAYDTITRELAEAESNAKKFSDQLKKCNDDLKNAQPSGIEKAGKALQAAGDKAKGAGDKIENIGKKAMAVTGAITALGAAAVAAFKEVDAGSDTIIKKTGATGELAESLQQSYENVAVSVKGTLESVGAAIGEINTRWGATGTELEDLATQFLQFSEINGQDVNSAIIAVDKAMKTFNVDASETGNVLGLITKTAQDTGIGVDTLEGLLQSSGAALQEMGLGLAESIQLMGTFEAAGIESSTMLSKMGVAAARYQKEGKNMADGLQDLITRLQDSATEADATAEAYEMFGTRAGLQFVTFAKQGKISLKNLSSDMSKYADVVSQTYENTIDGVDEMELTMKSVKIALAEFGEVLSDVFGDGLKEAQKIIQDITKKLKSMSKEEKEQALKIAAIVAAIGPVLTIGGKLVKMIGSISSAVGALLANPVALGIAAGAAAIAGIVVVSQQAIEATGVLTEEQKALNEALMAQNEAWKEGRELRKSENAAIVEEYAQTETLWQELQKITDENGKIKEGYEARAQVITGQLAEALGIEIGIVDGQIQKYDELKGKIDEVIEKKKASALVSAHEDEYINALENVKTAEEEVGQATSNLDAARESLQKLKDEYDFKLEHGGLNEQSAIAEEYKRNIAEAEKEVEMLEATHKTALAQYGEYVATIEKYEELVAAAASGNKDEIEKANDNLVAVFSATEDQLAAMAKGSYVWGKDMMQEFEDGIDDYAAGPIAAARSLANKVKNILGHSHPTEGPMKDDYKWMPDMMKSMAEGIRTEKWRVLQEAQGLAGQLQVQLGNVQHTANITNNNNINIDGERIATAVNRQLGVLI